MIVIGHNDHECLDAESVTGIEIRTRRGAIGTDFWGRRWMDSMDTACDPAELENGRRVARKSQVYHVSIQAGRMAAIVAENRAEPFFPELIVNPLDKNRQEQLVSWLDGCPEVVACLFAELLPQEVAVYIEGSGVTPRPEQGSCTCETELSGFCRHQVAMHCVFSEYLDVHPWSLLELYGVSRRDLMNHTRERWGLPPVNDPDLSDHRLKVNMQHFYGNPESIPLDVALVELPEFDVLERLGPPPFFPPNERNLKLTLEKLYKD